jgi:hypothetical protein
MHEPKYSFVSFGGLMRLIVFVHFVTVQDIMYHPGGEDAFLYIAISHEFALLSCK